MDAEVFRGPNLFALRVRGNSMKGAGILDGDLVICEPRQYAQNGEIVVALVRGEEATVKRFFLRADHIELRPENPDHAPMRHGFGEVLVQGKVIGLQRTIMSGPKGLEERPAALRSALASRGLRSGPAASREEFLPQAQRVLEPCAAGHSSSRPPGALLKAVLACGI